MKDIYESPLCECLEMELEESCLTTGSGDSFINDPYDWTVQP